MKCLARALATQILLSRCGYPSHLRFGIVKEKEGHLQAHAWVESQEEVVMGDLRNLSEFTPLPSLEGGRL